MTDKIAAIVAELRANAAAHKAGIISRTELNTRQRAAWALAQRLQIGDDVTRALAAVDAQEVDRGT